MTFSKKTAKGRLDKYYHLAKEQGYRARSAFKLIQLNRKFGFLENARVLVDLCAAPGGWLQVASKYMPMSRIIIGVDLVSIKPLPGITTFTSDITSLECRQKLQASLSSWKADVVLHDGAPNVGASWDHDAYAQSELVLHSLRVATEILRPGGTFVTKLFRSKDYNALLFVFNQLFKKVTSTKPASSRSVSAEIFVVCQEYTAPKKIDSKMLDPKQVFANSALLEDKPHTKTTMLHPERLTRNRGGYEDDASTMLYKSLSLSEFVSLSDPSTLPTSVNAIKIPTNMHDCPDPLFFQALQSCLPSEEIKESCADLKLLGKRELYELFRWHFSLRKKWKKLCLSNITNAETPITPHTTPEKKTDELDPLTLLAREGKIEKKKKKKALLRNSKTLERLRATNLEDQAKQELFDIPVLEEPKGHEEDDDDVDMELQLEQMYASYKQRTSHGKKVSPELEPSESQRKRVDLLFARKTFAAFASDEEEKENEDVIPSGHRASKKQKQKETTLGHLVPTIDYTLPEPTNKADIIKDVDDQTDEIDDPNSPYRKILETPLGASLALSLRSVKDDLVTGTKDSGKESLVDTSFNRYAFDDRKLKLPLWFLEDEAKHSIPQLPITAEAINKIREQARSFAAKLPKRVIEAKARSKARALRHLTSLQAKAGTIVDSEEMNESQKSAALRQLQKKSKLKSKKKIQVVVARGGNKASRGRPKGIKGRYKMVDSRMKKEQRALKRKLSPRRQRQRRR